MKVKAEASAWPDDRVEVRTFGHALEVDTRGRARPPSMALVLTSLGGCHVALLKQVLRRMKIEWGEIQLRIEAEETETEPKVYTQIHLPYEITGQGLSEQRLLRVVAMAEKYCSVSFIFQSAAVEITYDVRALEAVPPTP